MMAARGAGRPSKSAGAVEDGDCGGGIRWGEAVIELKKCKKDERGQERPHLSAAPDTLESRLPTFFLETR
jgi:hypothetical protein